MKGQSTYIGDGVYASLEGGMIKLQTDRDGTPHFIYLEPEVWDALVSFAEHLGWRT